MLHATTNMNIKCVQKFRLIFLHGDIKVTVLLCYHGDNEGLVLAFVPY